jgi:hypothetical protein
MGGPVGVVMARFTRLTGESAKRLSGLREAQPQCRFGRRVLEVARLSLRNGADRVGHDPTVVQERAATIAIRAVPILHGPP